jgi:hypothetical protein
MKKTQLSQQCNRQLLNLLLTMKKKKKMNKLRLKSLVKKIEEEEKRKS